MNPEYEYFGSYTDDASGEIKLEGQVRDFLQSMDHMFVFIERNHSEIREDFLEMVRRKFSQELDGTSFDVRDVGFDKIGDDESLLGSYHEFKNQGLKIIMKYIPLQSGYTFNDDPVTIRWIDYCRAKYTLLYHQLVVLVEILGRDTGIQTFKDFVDFWGEQLSDRPKGNHTIEQVRDNRVKAWSSGGGMEFGVVDVGEAAFLAKFDRCISYESMKHVDDQELAYYAVCYPGARLLEYTHENISMRRTQTLFTADFCDELRWDRHIHPDMEQPSLEFSRKLVRK